jgi:hypothetical protein
MNEKKNHIDTIIETEWEMFDKVQNISGRTDCQDNRETFELMRRSQFETWDDKLLASYLADLHDVKKEGRNIMTEKYAYMMEYTVPGEFAAMKDLLPRLSEEKKALVRRIADRNLKCYDELTRIFPAITGRGRPEYSSQETNGHTSIESYMLGELSTYSCRTLKIYEQYQKTLFLTRENIPRLTLEKTMKKYGFSSLEEAEQQIEEHEKTNPVPGHSANVQEFR